MPACDYGISRTLRFQDAAVRRAYYDHFWQTPRRCATVAACLSLNICYYAARLGLAQMQAGTADWVRLGLGGSDGAFAAAICAWLSVGCAYFLFLARTEARLARKEASNRRRPTAGLLNPSGMGIGKQNALLACIFWPVMLLRVGSTIWWPDEVLGLAPGDLFQWHMFEQSSFLLSMTLGYGPLCALIGVPAVVSLPQALVIMLVPVAIVWFDQKNYNMGDLSDGEIIGFCGLNLFLGAIALGITYAIAFLPMLIWKAVRAFSSFSL